MAEKSKTVVDDQPGEAVNCVRIKKYPNRRLYNTNTSSYIVLDDVVALVKSGEDFVVEDAKSGEDITRSILNQIIFEQETGSAGFHFPLEFQKQIIALYDDSYAKLVPDFLAHSMNLFSTEKAKMSDVSKEIDDAFVQNTKAMMDFSQNLARQNMELFRQSFSFFTLSGAAQHDQPEETDTAPEPDALQEKDALNDLQQQINALQAELKSIKSGS